MNSDLIMTELEGALACDFAADPAHWHEHADHAIRSALRAVREDAEEQVRRLRGRIADIRLRDAQSVGLVLDHAREALGAAWAELERAEEHHRWHHEQAQREIEPDEERLRVLMVLAEALDELGADEDENGQVPPNQSDRPA